MKIRHKYMFYLGMILFLIGLGMSTGLASLTIVRQPLDVKLNSYMRNINYIWSGDQLVVDLSHAKPTYKRVVPANGILYTSYDIGLADTKMRDSPRTNWAIVGFRYNIILYSNGTLELIATNIPWINGEWRGLNQYYAPLMIVIYKGTWGQNGVTKIVFNIKDRIIIIGNKQIPLFPDLDTNKLILGTSGSAIQPTFLGYIHLHGGYYMRKVTVKPRNPKPITTTTNHPELSTPVPTPRTETTVITHTLPSGQTSTQTMTHVVIATPVHAEKPTNNYGVWLTVAGAIIILIALL